MHCGLGTTTTALLQDGVWQVGEEEGADTAVLQFPLLFMVQLPCALTV
jgi:hypothetical protein